MNARYSDDALDFAGLLGFLAVVVLAILATPLLP